MRLAAVFASAFALFAFQCGGQVDEQCPPAPNQACVQEGKACTFPTSYCGQQTTETCTCKNGSFDCPVMAGDCPIDDCSLDTYPGSPCNVKGSQCPAMVKPECTNGPIMCTCDGHSFQCAIPDCPVPPMCPPPDSIVPGDGCSLPPEETCVGPDASECFCNNGTWACSLSVDGGAADAGGSD